MTTDAQSKEFALRDAILCRARSIQQEFERRGIVLSWEICHQQAERELRHQGDER